ncbi:E3 ubiquitin-protein ligase UHRF1 [Mytilus galloprovincialis]|nr:E3 ubiquitin-protein ligase UHRF1 [Mytilus galloprovincialis]
MPANEYEQVRLKNLEDNRRILAEIGLINPYKSLPKVSFKKGIRGNKRKAEDSTSSRPAKKHVELDPENSGSLRGSRRRSARVKGKEVPTETELKEEVDQWIDENDAPAKVAPNRPNFYGAVPGVEVGTVWATRMECCRDGIHRPTVAGIHAGQDGSFSIALSGGYEDNIDLGDCFTYTGEGGRDLKGTANKPKNLRTAPQSKDQTLTRGNLALSRNVETGNPVRVIRGYKLQQFSQFAPEDGYRYDDLYTVEKYWSTTGQSGFLVWKFVLRRCTDQPPPPWTFEGDGQSLTEEIKSDSGFDFDETASQISSSQSSSQSDEITTQDGKDEIQKKIKSERQDAPEKNEEAENISGDLNELKSTDKDTNGKCDQNATGSSVDVDDAKQNLKDEPKKKTTMKGNNELKEKVELMETESNEKVLDVKMEDGENEDTNKTGNNVEDCIETNDSTELHKKDESENKVTEESMECKSDQTEMVNEIEAA